MGGLLRLIEWLSEWSGRIIAWLLVPLILATVYDVLARYLFTLPTQWAYEVGYMMMGTHFLIGMALTLKRGGHIRIDAIHARFSQTTKALIDLVGYLFFVLPVTVWMTWALWQYWLKAYTTNEMSGQSAWNPPIWPFKLVFFISFVLLALQILGEIIKAIQYLSGRRPRYEAEVKAEAH